MRKFLILLFLAIFSYSSVGAFAAEPELAVDDNVKPQFTTHPPKAVSPITAIQKAQPDFGPYMRELQRRIKMCWNPPKNHESDRVVLVFTILKDGRLNDCKVLKSSGYSNADNAAILAVKLAAPFRPLPPEYKGKSVTVQFTFDYKVVGASIKSK